MSSLPTENRHPRPPTWFTVDGRGVGRRALLRASGRVLVGGAALALGGCGVGTGRPRPGPVDLGDLALRYTRLVLQLAKHQPSLMDTWLGPADLASGPRVPAPALRAHAATLLADTTRQLGSDDWRRRRDQLHAAAATPGATEIDDTDRAEYLAGQIRALDEVAGRLLGESHAFNEEAMRTFGHVAPVRDAAGLDAIRQQLSEALPGPGSLADRHAAFRRAAAVPPARVEAVFRAAVDWCRQASRRVLPLPDGETLTTRAEDTTGWAAFSRPTGPLASDLWVAKGGGADAAHLLQLAAHEGTPGHHAQLALASDTLVRQRGWTERLLHPAFGPHRLVAEGAAEAGADLLLPLDVREQVCRDVLLPAAGQSPALAARLARVERLAAALDLEVAYIAADYLDTALSAETATNRLRDAALVLDPAGLLAFVEKQRAKVLAYPVGRRLVLAALGEGPSESRWTRLAAVSTTLTLGERLGE